MHDRMLSVPEIAERLSVNPRWVRRQIFLRTLPVVKLNHLVRVRESDLEDFIKSNTRPADPDAA